MDQSHHEAHDRAGDYRQHHDHRHHDGHSHAHTHAHVPKDFGTMFAIATALNLGLVAIQVFYGVIAHSLALLADAGHNFGDALGLVIAWGAYVLSQLNPTARFTYGFRSASILAALLNSVILLVATAAIAWEAVGRFFVPGEVAGLTVMIVAAAGIAINGFSAWLLMSGQGRDPNIRGAFLHLVGDAAVSVGVVVAGGAILLTGWNWLDPAVSIVISALIVWGTSGLLREAVNRSLSAVPSEIDPTAVAEYLRDLPGVEAIHDLHVWAMSTTETALTCHLVMPKGHPGDEFLRQLDRELHHKFRIVHPTIQIELGDAGVCRLAPEHIV
jgi:cobalt-zinc-cadmium efflux system protein